MRTESRQIVLRWWIGTTAVGALLVGAVTAARPLASLSGDPDAISLHRVEAAGRFANRSSRTERTPAATFGRLAAPANARPMHRPIELAAGYTILPGGAPPQLAADLVQASAEMQARLESAKQSRGAYLVQFVAATAGEASAEIERAGASIVASAADGTFLVRMNERARVQLASAAGECWIAAWEPAFKLSPSIDRAAPGRVELTALIFTDGDAGATSDALRSLGATAISVHRNGINQLVQFELDAGRVAAVATLPDINWIEPTPHNTISNVQAQWVVQTAIPESRRVWDAGLRGQGQIVMTSDSGIRANHMMFDDPVTALTEFGDYPAHRKIIAYKRGSDDPVIEFGDDAGSSYHGTHTAGSAAGNNDPTDDNPYDGMAKDAKLYFMDLAGDASFGSISTPADLNDLFLPSYLGNAGGAARISSNSWGAPFSGRYTLQSMQVDQFMWSHPDYLILFANGNNQAIASVNSPASAKNCLSVGATGNGAERTSLYRPTSRGPTQDLRRKPTISAPGDGVGSSAGTTRYAYFAFSGTSMATPTAAGAMALVRQYLTEGWYPSGTPVPEHAFTPSAALLKAMAVNSGDNDVAGTHVPDNNVGWGRIDIDNVLYFPGDSRGTLLIDATEGLVDRQFVEYQVQVGDPVQPFSVSLCWTDAPGNPAFVRQLVNDLDLVVTNGAVTYVGNRMFNGVSLVGSGRDSLNVEECVRVPTPTADVWTVRIEGPRIGAGPQPYALCITGGVDQGSGSVALDRYEYAMNDTLAIEVIDTDATGSVAVDVASSTDSWGETVALGGTNGVFRGTLILTPSAPNPHDHRLAVSSGDAVTVTYMDASTSSNVTATARVSGVAPVITEVHAQALGSTAALVTWATDIPARSRVRFLGGSMLWRTQEQEADVYTRQHAIRLTGLEPGRSYRYDVESTGRTGAVSRDDFGGTHRTLTTKQQGRVALVLNGSSTRLLDTWMNAFDVLGLDADVFTGDDAASPLVGDRSVGLRSYSCVLWQVDPNAYPPISDAQRTTIDALLEGGARLLVTGHDIGYGLSDASVFSYTPEREAWLERGLKTRYFYDDVNFISTLRGTDADPISGAWVGGLPYFFVRSGATSDLIGPAPESGGTASVTWSLDTDPPYPCGLSWESDAGKGRREDAFWGGEKSRLLAWTFEWAGLATSDPAPAEARTAVLSKAVTWLLGRQPPAVHVLSPSPGTVVTSDVLPIRYTIESDPSRTIAGRSISYSLDGGESWKLLHASATPDSVYSWNLTGLSVPNSARAVVRVTASDNGAPALSGTDIMDAVFTIARPGGDAVGPVLVAGTLRTTPTPVRVTNPVTVNATFSDVARGDGTVTAAEYSLGTDASPAGQGTPMNLDTPAPTAAASVELAANSLPLERTRVWVRGRDAAGNWGPAAALDVQVNADERTDSGEPLLKTYLRVATLNRNSTSVPVRFGLAAPGATRLELFDVRGRRVRQLLNGSLPAGAHDATWDGRDDRGVGVAAGVYFVRLVTRDETHHERLVVVR